MIYFLPADQRSAHWLAEICPNVETYVGVKGRSAWREIVAIILEESYLIRNYRYHIWPMWHTYLVRRARQVKLLTLTWQPTQGSNDLYVYDMPSDLTKAVTGSLSVKQKPMPPPLPGQNILEPIRSALLSHGDRTVQKTLISYRKEIVHVENWLRKGEGGLRESDIRATQKGFDLACDIWEKALPFFALMPHRHALMTWRDELVPILRQFYAGKITAQTFLKANISRRMAQYLDDVITDITELYQLEKP